MTNEERQQSLANARLACEWLGYYIVNVNITDERIEVSVGPIAQARIVALVEEFKRLDAAARRPRAGRPRMKSVKPASLAQRRWRDKKREGK